MIGAGSYLLSATALAALTLSLAFTAYRLRQRLLSDWEGAPARLVEAITGIALLIWLSELLGTFGALYAWTLVASSLLLSGLTLWLLNVPPGGGASGGGPRTDPVWPARRPPSNRDGTPGPGGWSLLVMTGAIAVVVAHWGLWTDNALGRGIFNFDSLWYHMPFATDIAQSHSVTGFHHTETVFANWFYPQNSELLHAVGILIVERDTLSLFINYGWLAIALLAAWCIGRPYGRGHLSVVAVAILLESHILIVREPAAAKNDLAVAALLLAAIAMLITAWTQRETAGGGEVGRSALPVGWPLAAAGLAVGLAAGTKVTVLALAGALSVVAIALAPAGRHRAAAAWWFVPALLGGGYWYLRNLIAVGNPIPEIAHLGPLTLPHPEHLQTARPDFAIAHYATDTGVWSDYFFPGLHNAFGGLWPLVPLAALAGAILALGWGRNRAVRWLGGAVLFGMLAYLFTPLSAAGSEGRPTGFELNIRYLLPAMLAGLALLPLPRLLDDRRRQWGLLGALLVLLVLTDRSDAVLRDPSRLFGIGLAVLLVLVPAALLALRSARGLSTGAVTAGFAALALAVVAIGYPLQRDYLGAASATTGPRTNDSRAMASTSPTPGPRTCATPASAWPGPRPGSSATASTGPTSPTASSTSAKRAPTEPSTRSAPAAASAPPSTTPTSTISSPRPSSTSSTATGRCARWRPAGCTARLRSSRSSAAANSRSGGWAVASTPRPAAPPTRRSGTCPTLPASDASYHRRR